MRSAEDRLMQILLNYFSFFHLSYFKLDQNEANMKLIESCPEPRTELDPHLPGSAPIRCWSDYIVLF